jgi:hypothetical protein
MQPHHSISVKFAVGEKMLACSLDIHAGDFAPRHASESRYRGIPSAISKPAYDKSGTSAGNTFLIEKLPRNSG